MRKESFNAASEKISKYFESIDIQSFTTKDLSDIFWQNKSNWKIASYRTSKHFSNFLRESKILKRDRLKHKSTGSIKTIFSKPTASWNDIALSIKKDGYLSNYTAMSIHQLTLQIPKTIYLSFKKNYSQKNVSSITQTSIDKAFSKPQRKTSNIYKSEIDNYRIFLIQKEYTSLNIGINSNEQVTYTDLERTLIDIAIRPAYSGGVFEVLEAYIKAKDLADTNKIYKYLNQLNYSYPYQQLIGFYLEKAGYEENRFNMFYNNVSKLNFYLTYNISNKVFNDKWKIYFPKGF